MRRRHVPDQKGQSLVEFALVAPIFFLILIGLFDLGRAVLTFNTISNASREAVRLGIVNQNAAGIRAAAIDSAGGVAAIVPADVSIDFLAPDLTPSATCSTAPYEIGCVISVAVSNDFQPVLPVIPAITMTAETHQPIERRFASP